MDRRLFVRSLGVMGAAALAGCVGSVDDAVTGSDDAETPTKKSNPDTFRVDFVDETGTLGHIADGYSTQKEFDKAVNDYTEDEWDVFDTNDIDNGNHQREKGVWAEGNLADHLDEIQPFVEYTMGMRDDLPGHDPGEVEDGLGNTLEQKRQEDMPWAHKLAWGTGFGIDKVLPGVDSSLESAQTVLPGIEYFAKNLLDRGEELETIAIPSQEPRGDQMTHIMGILSYNDENGDLQHRYIEPTIGGGTPGWFNSVIRSPEESIYAHPAMENAANPLEYTKAKRLTEAGEIDSTYERPGLAGLSGGVAATLWGYVDVAGLGSEIDFPERNWDLSEGNKELLYDNFREVRNELEPEGYPVTVSPRFGQSVEDNFDNYSPEVEQKFENIGRGIQTFYEEFGSFAPLGIGGTVEDPEFYKMGIDDMQEAWNTDYQKISAIVG